MFIRQYFKDEQGTRTAYWALVESYRTERGPRQRVVAWLGKLDEAGRLGIRQAAQAPQPAAGTTVSRTTSLGARSQQQFEFDDDGPAAEPRWVEVNAAGVRVENLRHFGGPWLAIELIRRLKLDEFLEGVMPRGQESVRWSTVEHVVETMERRYGKSDRIWVMDRGMVSEENITFLRAGSRRYIVGTPKSMLKTFERELLKDDWTSIREGLEVKIVAWPKSDDDHPQGSAAAEAKADEATDTERFILCRSRDRFEKEEAMTRRFEQRIADALARMQARCETQRRDPMKVEREVGRLLGKNTRAARLYDVRVESREDGFARLSWSKREAARDWATLSAGCYLLRTNVADWSDEDLWKACIQLTEAEAAFRIHKSDLSIRPIWHQKEDRVLAHMFVCFLGYVLWKTLGQLCSAAGLGDEPRRVLSELSEIRLMDVVLPTRTGIDIRTRCISKPSEHQQILLDRLHLRLPSKIKQKQM